MPNTSGEEEPERFYKTTTDRVVTLGEPKVVQVKLSIFLCLVLFYAFRIKSTDLCAYLRAQFSGFMYLTTYSTNKKCRCLCF